MIKKKLSEKNVEKFLLENPDFFINNSQLLNKLSFPSEKIHKKQTKIISYKDWIIQSLKIKQKSIIDNAKYNFFTQKKVLECSLKILKTEELKKFLNFLCYECPGIFDLEVINIISCDKNFTQKFNLIFKEEKIISQVFDCNKYLILDAVDENLNLFSDFDSKIYSNAIFSLDIEILNSPMLLVYGSKDNHFLSNKAFDLIFYLSKVIEKKLIDLV
ncbi:MAG: hypothetical protein CMM99_02920 [Rickettsiales bacterium]|nr:hypothetical protein [Rickettsiales bacterium]